jgi:hypothetical protein
MSTDSETSPNHDRTDQPLVESLITQGNGTTVKKAKAGIGGCLLYPLLFLIAQPLIFVYILLTSRNSSYPMATNRIFLPYLIYDLVLVGAVIILLLLFARKKASLPAMFVLFLISFAILSGLLADVFSRLPEARVTGRDPLLSHMVILLQCLLLVPYFTLDGRVKNTFINEADDKDMLDQMLRPIAAFAGRLYHWLMGREKKVILFIFVFVILVFLLDWAVDSIVLYGFLS